LYTNINFYLSIIIFISTLNNIAVIHKKKGGYEEALKLLNASLEIEKQIGDQKGIANTLNNIAFIHDNKGEYEEVVSRTPEIAWDIKTH
jgi:tetratricopeptide (TPR) repeat protein